MPTPPLLVTGAGPTGLTLALWLTKLGVRVRIIDKADGPAEYSQALGVHARTLELYRQVGIAEEAIAGGVQAVAANFWARGERAARLPLGAVGEGLTPYPFVLDLAQSRHERLLIERLAMLGVEVEWGTELLGLQEREGVVQATLRRGDEPPVTCETPFLAGCDGAHSAVREALGVDFPGAAYPQLFYVADVVADGRVVDDEIHVDLDESDLLAIFPMPGAGHIRLVGIVREEPGVSRDGLSFDDVSETILRRMKVEVREVHWFSPYRVHHRVARAFRRGRVFLAGDAAHIHSPVGAQGMNTGIGDAVNLAWKLAAVVRGEAPVGLLDSYEPERIGFARRLVATTDRVFVLATRRGPLARLARTRLLPSVVGVVERLAPMRRFLFRTVSQLAVSYRRGPLSEGSAGHVHGGDRLPWVGAASPRGDNFAPLASLAWQVHVYGDTSRRVREACAGLGLTLHEVAWTPAARQAGLERGALYLVRPDGYVALAAAEGGVERLRRYLEVHGLGGFGSSASGGPD